MAGYLLLAFRCLFQLALNQKTGSGGRHFSKPTCIFGHFFRDNDLNSTSDKESRKVGDLEAVEAGSVIELDETPFAGSCISSSLHPATHHQRRPCLKVRLRSQTRSNK